MTQGLNAPSPKTFFHLKIFLFFLEWFGNLEFFFEFFCFFVFNIYTQTKLIKCYMKFLNYKKKNRTHGINKQTLSLTMMLQTKCGVRQSWATCFFLVHLGCLRLSMLEPWLWWNGLGLHLEGLNLDYDLLVFAWNGLGLHLEGMHLVSFWPLMLIMHIHLW